MKHSNLSFCLYIVPNEPHLTPDDDVFEHLALGYARRHPVMHKGKACSGLHAQSFPQGVTNGAAWYPLSGTVTWTEEVCGDASY